MSTLKIEAKSGFMLERGRSRHALGFSVEPELYAVDGSEPGFFGT
jgi:hypothetical protein